MESKSLFDRLGGSKGIERIVDEVASRHLENPVINPRFKPYLATPDKLLLLKKHLANFLELGSGGPQRYEGRSMPDAHRGMNINEAEYMSAMDDIMGALKAVGVDDQTQKDVLAICWSLKGDIMRI